MLADNILIYKFNRIVKKDLSFSIFVIKTFFSSAIQTFILSNNIITRRQLL